MLIRSKDGRVLADTSIVDDLSEVDLREADFSFRELQGIFLDGANLEGADFSGADLYWANLFCARCNGCSFRGANLAGAILDGADMRGADLRDTYISYDNLGGSSSIKKANLTEVKWKNAVLNGCEYDEHTLLPSGLDPVEAGMVFVSSQNL